MSTTPEACGSDAVSILGVPFDRLTVGDAILRIERMIESRKPHYVVTANMDFVVQAREDVELRRILMEAHMVLCDGTPLVWASKLLGNGIPERVAGSDLTPLLLSVAAEKSYRVFILGGTPKAAEGAAERILEKLPGLNLAHYSPPFHVLLDMNHDEIRQRILEARPDILLVSFGCPKQEKWIAMHYRELGVPVSIGVGATIDFLAGQVRRAPVWMQRSGFEWMFRLSQEPRRLLGRYSRDMFVFGSSFLAQLLIMRAGANGRHIPQPNGRASETPPSCKESLPSTCRFMSLPEKLDQATLSSRSELWVANESSEGSMVLDGSRVAVVDSTGLALLIRLNRAAMSRETALVILSPSRTLERILSFARLQSFFLTANSLSEAQALVLEHEQEKTACVTWQRFTDELRVWWKGEVTAASTSVYANKTCSLVEESDAGCIKRIRLELADVAFIDSTGLGTLIRIRKFAARQGIAFSVAGMQPAVQNVVRLANLESVFLPGDGSRMFHIRREEETLQPSP